MNSKQNNKDSRPAYSVRKNRHCLFSHRLCVAHVCVLLSSEQDVYVYGYESMRSSSLCEGHETFDAVTVSFKGI